MDDSRKPTPIDILVGSRIRIRRRLMSLSQQELADRVGITFQQIQKYEKGANRIVASRLYAIAQALEAPITYFFEGLEESEAKLPPRKRGKRREAN